jgi:hypothetical protein
VLLLEVADEQAAARILAEFPLVEAAQIRVTPEGVTGQRTIRTLSQPAVPSAP